MDPKSAQTFVIDCGSMVGHEQRELELVLESVPFFDVVPSSITQEKYIPMMASDGSVTSYRLIHRHDNAMWRIEFVSGIPEINRGIFPVVNGVKKRRSNHAAIFKKQGPGHVFCSVKFVPIDSDEYQDELDNCKKSGNLDRSVTGPSGRQFGWY